MVLYNPQVESRKQVIEQLVTLEDTLNRTIEEAIRAGLKPEVLLTIVLGRIPHVHVHIEPHDD